MEELEKIKEAIMELASAVETGEHLDMKQIIASILYVDSDL